ncbi:tachykinin-4 [Corythoichthys intestinalis]|uniref:tachykinin-4 n=1 Tax=Corythoichthys intestinalis TaxID=161448 RepID=UPI0025A5CB91|nr:tachykinin-4 [Corythoichthys intestinalis]XP_061805040.1 protachykinin-1-like [Nerophis lumbriciformis]
MDAVRFATVLLVMLTQSLGALGSPLSSQEEGREVWTLENWQDFPLERGITIRLADLIKRSKAQQFHGLMGRSLGVAHPMRLERKRNKGDMFVGLMGRRSLDEDIQEEWKSYSY